MPGTVQDAAVEHQPSGWQLERKQGSACQAAGQGQLWWAMGIRKGLESKDRQAVSENCICKRLVKQQRDARGTGQQWVGKVTGTATSWKVTVGKTTCMRAQQIIGSGRDVELLSKGCSCLDALGRAGHRICR